jgi:hypothetical protein
MPLLHDIIGFWARHVFLGIGCILLVTAIWLVFHFDALTAAQNMVVRVTCSTGAALIMAGVPGVLNVNIKTVPGTAIGATGALAVFVLAFWLWPQ